MELCVGTFPSAKACMLLDWLKNFVGFDLDSDVCRAVQHDLFLTVALQMVNPKSVSTGGEELRGAARALAKMMILVSTRKKRLRGRCHLS